MERPEPTTVHPGDTDTGRSHLGELLLPCGHWCWQVSSWNSPFSSLAPRPAPSPQQQITVSVGMTQAKKPPEWRHSHTHKQTGCLQTPCTHRHLWTWPCPPRAQHSVSTTSRQAEVPESPGPWVLPSREPALASRPVSPTREQVADSRNYSSPAYLLAHHILP